MKKEWQLWNKLIGKETGLGWDPIKKTIDASNDWWNKRLEIVPEAAKFREKGLEHCFKLDILFMDVIAIGDKSWAPSLGFVPSQMGLMKLNLEKKIMILLKLTRIPLYFNSQMHVGMMMISWSAIIFQIFDVEANLVVLKNYSIMLIHL
ncbi:hypothetical protein ACH5RR_037214 [Cinchona calisaya]|uniref:Myb/SANT-like domain-containing protein n=1 Tax=Cinchona calisaya TaxID=153742 RepID=A0ABD2YAC0_9GENT